jgi:ubiquinone/menaquinone biosynthesis C-methylase UbiE
MSTERPSAGDSTGYPLGQSEEEAQRLQDQAQRTEEETRAAVAKLGLGRGAKCLDVGCGAGDVMRLMAEHAGLEGSVTGLDLNDGLGGALLERLNATGLSNFSFIQDDVHTTTQILPDSFDLTFARFLLLHVPDPVAVIKRMWQWTKPGGYLLVMDYDFHTQGAYPPLAAVDEYNRVIFELFSRTGRDPRVGHKLPAHVAAACGGGHSDASVHARMWPMGEIADLLSAGYKSLLPTALKLGIVTEEQAPQFFAQMAAARSAGSHFLSPLLVCVSKQKT